MTTTTPDLAALESRTWRSTHQDGTLDVVTGLWVASLGLAMTTDVDAAAAIAPAVLLPIWIGLRKRVIEPRLGWVRFGPDRRERIRSARLWLVGGLTLAMLGGLGFALWIERGGAGARETMRSLGPMPLGVVLGAVMAAGAFRFEAPRFLAWAPGLTAAFCIPHLLGLEAGPWVMAAGLSMAAAGTFLLVRFLRTHPLAEETDGV